MFLVGSEKARLPLCLDCNLKFVQMTALQNDMLEREMNFVVEIAEATTGVYGAMPRFPQRQVVQMGSVTLNNIKVDRSTIGVLNTGTIGTVDAAVSALKQSGATDAADVFTRLTETILKESQLTQDTKNQLLELLSVLSAEATAPKDRRRSAMAMALLERLSTLLSGAAAGASSGPSTGGALQELFS